MSIGFAYVWFYKGLLLSRYRTCKIIVISLNNLRSDCFPQEMKVLTIMILLNFYQKEKLPKITDKH